MTNTNSPTLLNSCQVEAALCIWEWMTERKNMADATDGSVFDMITLWEDVGTGQMRNLAARVATPIESLYQSLCKTHGEDELRAVYLSYDWDFIPAVCERLDWSGEMFRACYHPGEINISDEVSKHFDFKVWEYKARQASGLQWGYKNLIDDAPEEAEAAFDNGEAPGEYVERVGRDLGLTIPDPMAAQSLKEQYS